MQVVVDFINQMTSFVRQFNDKCSVYYNSGHIRPGIGKPLVHCTHFGVLIAAVAAGLFWPCSPALAQSPPTDLTELGIEEILALHIIRKSTDVEEETRWSVGYR